MSIFSSIFVNYWSEVSAGAAIGLCSGNGVSSINRIISLLSSSYFLAIRELFRAKCMHNPLTLQLEQIGYSKVGYVSVLNSVFGTPNLYTDKG